jgi:uncharacterized protein
MKNLETRINEFLKQKRIAVVGVSRHLSNHPSANLIYNRLKKLGHEVFAVNPYMQTYEGDRCYASLQSIPGGVDAAVIITRPEITEKIVEECHAAGVNHVWMHQGTPRKATSVSPKAVDFCHQHNIDAIPGACPMMYGPNVDFGHACMRWMLKLTGGLPT